MYRNLPKGLNEARVKKHVISPTHIRNVRMEEIDESKQVKYEFPPVSKEFKATPKVDLGAFGLAVHTILKDRVVGYILQIRQHGNLVYHLVWNWAQTPADQNKGWNEDTRMHMASVSKYLTAVGLVKSLVIKGISYDTHMIDYLPKHWSKGNNIDKITFRHLLRHESGFAYPGTGSLDYAFMKDKIAAGVAGVGSYDYENMNFCLCRILIPIINGKISKNAKFIDDTALNDQVWDAVTIYHYKNYMQKKIFTPAGISNATFEPLAGAQNALAYPFPAGNSKGWNSGDLATASGGAGWRLSIKELLNVMNHVRRKNTIVSKQRAQYMLENSFGIDVVKPTPGGWLYNKNGYWEFDDGNKKWTEQCVTHFLPDEMEAAVFVNSRVGTENFFLRDIITDAFTNSLSN